jgi:hypothetical protein
MLPLSYHQAYENLYSALNKFSLFLSSAEFPLDNTHFKEVRSLFISQIVLLTGEDLCGRQLNQWRSIQTELHRGWRLLETDWLFLGSAKEGANRVGRLKTVRERVVQMSQYCQILLKSENDNE